MSAQEKSMCSPQDLEEMKKVVRDVLTEKDNVTKKTLIEEQVSSMEDRAIKKLTYRLLVPAVIIVFGFGGWTMQLTTEVTQNTKARSAGDRYTLGDHVNYKEEVDRRFEEVQNSIFQLRTDYKEDITEMKEDLRFIRQRLDRE